MKEMNWGGEESKADTEGPDQRLSHLCRGNDGDKNYKGRGHGCRLPRVDRR